MWILILITAGSSDVHAIDHVEFASRERCIVAQQFSIKRDTILDAYCVQK